MILEKDGKRITLTSEIQIAAYKNSGWQEVRTEEKNGSGVKKNGCKK